MPYRTLLSCVLICLAAFTAESPAQTTQPAAKQSADEMLKTIFLPQPTFNASRSRETEYVKSYLKSRDQFWIKQAALDKTYCDTFPTNRLTPMLVEQRWILLTAEGDAATVAAETSQALAHNPYSISRTEILYARARSWIDSLYPALSSAVEEFLAAAPADERGAGLLTDMATKEDDPEKKAAIYLRVVRAFPNSQCSEFARWNRWIVIGMLGRAAGIEPEMAEALSSPNLGVSTRMNYLYARAFARIASHSPDAMQAINECIKFDPLSEQGGELLFRLSQTERDRAKRLDVDDRIIAAFPDTAYAKFARGDIAQGREIGELFDLDFRDALTGKPLSIQKDLKGKIVLVDFWATWCGACDQATPQLKELYGMYKGQRVEFISVSMDQPESRGGLQSVRDYVTANMIPWPQCYRGHGWPNELTARWNIEGIPTFFVLDANGRLRATTFSIDQVGQLLSEAIAERNRMGAVGKTQ